MKRIEFEDALVVKSAKVSILDEMPVGTVVDYDGDEVPAGWEELDEELPKVVEDALFYKDGDTFTNIGYLACIGHLTSSQKSIYFTLPFEKRLDNINSITVNSISANIRHANGGYVAQGDLTTLGTVSVSKSTNNILRIRFDLTTASTVPNNSLLAVDISDIDITFNK